MDGEAFRERVESAKSTELERLGSNKLLIALTDATLEPEAVLRAVADSEHAAHVTFSQWADDATEAGGENGADGGGDAAAELFGWLADRERDHRERVLDSLSDLGVEHDPADGGTMHEYLRAREDPVERIAAGTVGRGLVSDRSHLQIVSLFVNEGDEARADLFRDLRAETEEELERGLALLEDLCGDEDGDDWERARMVAEYVVQVAYDDYADALTGMGIDVKPVC
ncbi:rubrerythrin family protein [Halobaculum sp. CBA1158]|uniref:rubrerythrin family protein n=1 Tax=Halobaculum sp. CBA1158 TaxID=2904243 RepID=UPI001F483454|nr:rubrerythrin family protein [Halobaculum sp. CBA1158]UIO99181.1 rubrerythrin family protein [Halobaculum sp. CBA1158]